MKHKNYGQTEYYLPPSPRISSSASSGVFDRPAVEEPQMITTSVTKGKPPCVCDDKNVQMSFVVYRPSFENAMCPQKKRSEKAKRRNTRYKTVSKNQPQTRHVFSVARVSCPCHGEWLPWRSTCGHASSVCVCYEEEMHLSVSEVHPMICYKKRRVKCSS
jgi:hypothetical protein